MPDPEASERNEGKIPGFGAFPMDAFVETEAIYYD
jgi:hypothetical protein